MRKNPTVTVKIDRRIMDRLKALLPILSPANSSNALAEACLDQMVTLMESAPEKRITPSLLLQIDAVRTGVSRPVQFATINSTKVDQAILEAAEISIARAKAKARQ